MSSPPSAKQSAGETWLTIALFTALAVIVSIGGSPDQLATQPKGVIAERRGGNATSPAEIPASGWKDILWRVYQGINDDRILAVAAGVTFYALLALFPAVSAIVSLYGLFADPATISDQLVQLSNILPSGAVDIVGEQVKRVASKPHGSLSFAFAFSLLVALWSANAGMKAMFDALNVAYEEKERRSFVVLNAASLAFTLGAILMLILAMAAVVVVPVVLGFLGISGLGTALVALARWPLLLALVALALAVLYRYAPSRGKTKWRWITPGSIFAAIAWIVASVGFSVYVSRFGSYNATYGSLGAAIGLMTWMWISSIVVLVGAEINAQTEHHAATAPTEKPPGGREAAG